MSKIVIFEKEYGGLWYHPDSKIVHQRLYGFVYGEAFRSTLDKGLEVMQEYKAEKWLSDNRDISALPAADREWGINDWFPRASEAGWKYWAIVMSSKMVVKLSMALFIKAYSQAGIIVQIFTDPDEALKWLESL